MGILQRPYGIYTQLCRYRTAAKGLLKDVTLFDIYQGSNLPTGKKSVAFNLILRADDRSLTAQEADDEVKLVLESLEKAFGATLR